MMLAASISSINKNSSGVTPTLIRNLEATFYKFQRHNVPFTVTNMTTGTGTFSWKILNLTTPGITATSSARNPEFTLSEGHYLLYGEVTGLNPNPVARVFWHKRITVLPVMFDEGDADRVLDLDNGNNIFDATTWGDGERIYVKAASTVGRLRINNLTSTSTSHLLFDSPMTFNSFVGSHGIYLVNCQNVLIDAVGTTDAYNITLDGMGESTSHGICLNLVSDIRCRNVAIYGVDIQVDEVGASGVRVLGDESASYNRNITTPLEGLKFAHIKGRSGAELFYLMYTADADGGFGGPPKADAPEVWDIDVQTCVRNPFQWGSCINGRAHDIRVVEACTGGESSHNSYISDNSGNENCKIFNFFGFGGIRGISKVFGETDTEPYYWNIVMEVIGTSASNYNFIRVGTAPNCPIYAMNIQTIGLTDEDFVYRFDASTGTQDINKFILTNQVSKMGNSASFWQKDGTNPETNWDRTTGNQNYITSNYSTAMLGSDYLPNDVTSPVIDGGVSMIDYVSYADIFGEYDDLQFEYDCNGYIKGLDGEFCTGAGAGIPLKLAAL